MSKRKNTKAQQNRRKHSLRHTFLSQTVGTIRKMETPLIMVSIIVYLLGCSGAEKSEVNEKKVPSIELEDIQIQVIEKWPDEIDGCSCYSSRNQDELKKREYIYMDDYVDNAFMNISGRIESFRLIKSDTLASSESSKETWTNERFELIIETEQIGQIEETWQHKGKLTLKSNDGAIIEKEIYGECGC